MTACGTGRISAQATVLAKRTGLVVLLDALGTRHDRSEEEWLSVTTRRMETLRRALEIQPINVFKGDGGPQPLSPSFNIRPSVSAFSDTLLLTFEANDARTPAHELLGVVPTILSGFFVESLSHADVLRGAISFGTYFEGDRLLTGPAVLDVARYHDIADWAGIILTPRTGSLWEEGNAQAGRADMLVNGAFRFLETDVPISPSICGKRRKSIETEGRKRYALSWAWLGSRRRINSPPRYEERRGDVVDAFRSGPPGPDGERKLSNTLRFFDAAWEIAYPPSVSYGGIQPGGPSRPSGPAPEKT